MSNITWEKILWTNDGIFMTASATRKALRNCVRSWPGEALRFDLHIFHDNCAMLIDNLHVNFRSLSDTRHFESVLNAKHDEFPKATFRVFGYRAKIEKEYC